MEAYSLYNLFYNLTSENSESAYYSYLDLYLSKLSLNLSI